MPRNKFGGNKAKKGKNYTQENDELVLKDEDQFYATVTKVLGNCRVELACDDGITRLGHIRGKMRKRVWINLNDTVLASGRDYQDNKCDVLHKYTSDQVRKLVAIKQIVPDQKQEEEECSFNFDEI